MTNGTWKGIVYRRFLKVTGDEWNWSYIGETTDEKGRMSNWNKPHSQSYGGKKIMDARKKYGIGEDVWGYEVLETVTASTKEKLRMQLEALEAAYIAKYDSYEHGFNSNRGGSGSNGVKLSDERRKQIGETSRGRRHSEETKKQISETLKGRHHTEEAKAKISAANRGRKLTPEQRQAISSRMKGKTMSEEARRKSSLAKKGKPHYISPEGMANINAHRFKIGVEVTYENGESMYFSSLVEAAADLGVTVAAISYTLRHSGYMPSIKCRIDRKQKEER